MAFYYLEGDAQLWFLKVERDEPVLSWADFKEHCNQRFGPALQCTKLGELTRLRQTGTIDEYQRQFEQLSTWASTLS